MAEKPVIFALANPIPEILPEEALAAGAYIVGTGRSDYPNQMNNVLAFPGIFRGVLDAKATKITDEMQIAAAVAIANLISEEELTPTNIMPNVFQDNVAQVVAQSVMKAI
jgi:malate dehydrogenase (oxaloacetate-decarboxylating)